MYNIQHLTSVFFFNSEIHGGEVMRINMCAAIIFMQSIFLIGAHVKAQQVFKHSPFFVNWLMTDCELYLSRLKASLVMNY